MSSKYLTILLAVAAILLNTSCSSDDMDNILASGPVSAQVTASINDGKTVSRVTNDGNSSTFATDDVIHVVAASTTTNDYTYDGSSWSSTSPYYFTTKSSVSFTGWYSAVAATDNSISIDTTTGQATSSTGWSDWDILVAPAVSASVSSPSINFTDSYAFQHIMSKMTFTFTAGDGFTDISTVNGYAVKYITTDATFNTLTCELTTGSTTGNISQTVSSATTTEVICNPFILVPQTLTNGKFTLEVTFSDNTAYSVDLSLPNSATALAAGTHYTYTVSINKTGLEVVSAAINDWNTASAVSDDAYLKDYYYTTSNNVRTYYVYNQNGLNAWADYVNAASSSSSSNLKANCTLMANITMTDEWTAVGKSANNYTGTFEGNGYTITNLTITSPSNSGVGLIGYLGTGTVQNLTLENVSITSGKLYTGAVVGYNNGGTITNCSVSGTIYSSARMCGGVAGYNRSGTITNCYVTGNVTSTTYYVGGVAGNNSSSVTSCYSTGTVSGTYHVGGVAGNNSSSVTSCYSTGNVSSTSYNAGGVVGDNSGTVTASYATGNVSGPYNIGGVVGENSGSVIASYATGDVTGTATSVANSNEPSTGGAVGYNDGGTVTACYATGKVSSTLGYYTGGAVGYNDSGTVSTCYWNNSSTSYGIGADEGETGSDTEGVTTYVDGTTITWAGEEDTSALNKMNSALSTAEASWQYIANTDSDDPPLLLESTATE